MPVYIYKARNQVGDLIKGTFEAESTASLEYMLNEKGFFPTSIEEEKKSVSLLSFLERVTIKDVAVFCRQLAVILNSGITILEAVSILELQLEKKNFREILGGIHADLQKGRLLSEAMGLYPGIFPEFLLNMVRVGEASGTLDQIMNEMADYYEKENKLNRKVKSAMTYPMILAVMTVGVVILLMVMVLPMFSSVLSSMGGELPGITKALIAVSDFFVKNLLLIIGVIIAAVVAFSAYSKSEAGRYRIDALKLKLPIIKTLTIKVTTSRFARSMGILLKSGISILNAMEIMSVLMGNKVVEKLFMQCRDDVREGYGISDSVDKMKIFPPLLIHMVAVGESTGELDQMLTRTAGFFDEEVDEAVEKMTTMIEPIMIVILAAVVGVIMLSIMLPMLSIMSAIQ